MNKQKMMYLSIALVILASVMLFTVSQVLQRERTIVLPTQPTETGSEEGNGTADSVDILSVTPETVQSAIGTLTRPAVYERTQTVTTFWNGGESSSVSQVAVSNGVVRMDTTLSDSSVRHVLMNGTTAAVWYDEETTWVTLAMGEVSSDAMQRMPTYETVLALSVREIAQAEYGERDGVRCLSVSTCPTEDGYTTRYWVSVDSGLLFAAERWYYDSLIYRFTADEPTGESPQESRFVLPDGTRFS